MWTTYILFGEDPSEAKVTRHFGFEKAIFPQVSIQAVCCCWDLEEDPLMCVCVFQNQTLNTVQSLYLKPYATLYIYNSWFSVKKCF